MIIQKNPALLLLLCLVSSATLLTQKTVDPAKEADREARRELQAAVRQEMREHHEAVELPVILEARRELETRISVADRREIQRLRELMKSRPKPIKGERPETREELHANRREAHEAMKSWREEHSADLEALKALVRKYDGDIEETTRVIVTSKPQWKADREAIREKYLGEGKGRRGHHHHHDHRHGTKEIDGPEKEPEQATDRTDAERPHGRKHPHHGDRHGHPRHGKRGGHHPDKADEALLRKGKFLLLRTDRLSDQRLKAGTDVVESGIELSVSPNPAREVASISVNLTEPMSLRFRLVDESGRTVVNLPKQSLEAGRQSVALDLSGLQAGRYTLVAQTDRVSESLMLIVNQ